MNIDAYVSCGRTRDWHIEVTVTTRALTDVEIEPTDGSLFYVIVEDEHGNTVHDEYVPEATSTKKLQQGERLSYTRQLDTLVSDTTYTVEVYAVGLIRPSASDQQMITEAKINPT